MHITPSELALALLAMEYPLKDALYVLTQHTKRSEKTDFMKLKADVDKVYIDLKAVIEPSDLMGLPQDMGRIVSIQVQTTRLTGAGVEVVSFMESERSTGPKATHWSLYTRNADGIATWVEDIAIAKDEQAGHRYAEALVKAAKLSMAHGAFIEELK